MPTFTPKAGDTTRKWYVIDAQDVVLGRLAVEAAKLLRGKHKPTFTPNVDGGDFVIIVNADQVPAVIALVAVPARREGRELLTERGEEVVVKVRRSTDKVGQATSGIAGATKAGAAKVRSLRQ